MKNCEISPSNSINLKNTIVDNIVPILFLLFTLFGFYVSEGLPMVFFVRELSARFFRNIFLVLSLVIPVIAGLGLNFGIVIGAMSAQAAVIAVRFLDLGGLLGISLCYVIAFPIAVFLGYITGQLYNKTRGQEMIASLIVGFFANGIYQFIFLYCVGAVIPVPANHPMVKPDGIGIRATLNLGSYKEQGLQYAIDNILKIRLIWAFLILAIIAIIVIFCMCRKKNYFASAYGKMRLILRIIPMLLIIVFCVQAISSKSLMMGVKIPVVTTILISGVCVFTDWLLNTKLGQDFRSVGNSQYISQVSGIDIDKKRIMAVIMSTVLAAFGQIIFLQDIGTLNTYSAHEQIGLFSVASLLVGGASVVKANIWNAILGTILFNAMFIMSPEIGKAAFGQVLLGEYFRTFMVYGVIGLSLGIYVWKDNKAKRRI